MKQDVTKIQIVFLMLAALVNLCNTKKTTLNHQGETNESASSAAATT